MNKLAPFLLAAIALVGCQAKESRTSAIAPPSSTVNISSQTSLTKGKQVGIQEVDVNRYGRTVAEVFADGRLVQAKQAEQGTVYVYQKYLHNCPDAKLVTDAEAIAKGKQVGVWSGNYQKPWDFRRAQRNEST